ncbi:MAG: hypothetical protein PHX93_00145 [Candidatus Peribacteraceae bacterium]|jgi:hypothetical protein|nr:hypothetical protein [Candidatus Peribacteraceae bacterium]
MNRENFIKKVAMQNLTRAGQAIALLWFYRETQTFEERSASELADDLRTDGLGKPNVTELKRALTKDPKTVKGKRSGTFQINVKHLDELSKTYGPLLELKKVPVTSSILPVELTRGTRHYIEKMVAQINGSYDYGFFDSCAVLLRRLMESLIIESFIKKNMADKIKTNGKFIELEKLISAISSCSDMHLGRGSSRVISTIKQLGDTAAHDRVYITQQQDLDDTKQDARKLIQELLTLSGIIK